MICAQEHKVLEADIAVEKNKALARGWKSLWSPAVPSGTAANQASGGTAVFVRNHIGVEKPPGGEIVVPGHAAAAMIETSGMGWLVLYSVCGVCGDELGARNWEICKAVCCHATAHGLPWMAAGDWNFEPNTLRSSGWLVKMNAELFAAEVQSTTHAGNKKGRLIDYFIASRRVAALGPRLSICADAIIRTHDAVRLRIPVAPRQFYIRRLIRPAVFPRELPIGPRPLLVTPDAVLIAARAAKRVGEQGDVEAATLLVDEATEAIIEHMERVFVSAYMIGDDEKSAYLGRRDVVKFARSPILGPNIGRYGAAPPAVRRLRMIQDRANALSEAAARQRKRMTSGRCHLEGADGDRNSWLDLLERAKAAIHSGHHVHALDRDGQGPAEQISAAYALELKGIGRWAEEWATWAIKSTASANHTEPCGRSLHDTTPDGDDPSNWHAGWLDEVTDWAAAIRAKAEAAAQPAEAALRNEKAAAVRKWAEEASHAGAAMAHRWTKIPEGWRPETVGTEVDGMEVVTADPGAVVDAEKKKWEALWCPSGVARDELRWGTCTLLPRPCVERFRWAARRFPRSTGIGVEGILPADFDALDDEGVDACIDLMMACEAIGYVPKLISLVLVRMIPKKDGGRRPIGLLPSLYRMWAKIRAGTVRDWERRWARAYFAAGPGKSAEAAAWMSAMRAEMAAAANASSASVLWDLMKCFEHGKHFLLASEAQEVEFPIVLARMSAEMYRAERRLIIDDAISDAIHPTRGFMAGCARAVALIKVIMIRRMDAYVARHPRVLLDVYVDDVELQAVGTERIADTLADAVIDLRKVLTQDLGFPLADDKAHVVASTGDLADAIVETSQGAAGRASTRAVKLGVELTSGKRAGRRGDHKRARLRKALARQKRLLRFRRMGGAATKVIRRGVIPSTAFGNCVSGVSDAELRQIRMLVAKSMAPNTKGASAALKLLLEGDPAVEANAAPITKWAEAAWDASTPLATDVPRTQCQADVHAAGALGAQRRTDGDDAGVIGGRRRFNGVQLDKAMARATADTEGGSWETVRGPASATCLTAKRVGWHFISGTTVRDELGKTLDMAKMAPACIKAAVARATRKTIAAAAATRWGRPEFAQGIWTTPVKTALGRLRPAAKAALRRAWTGGYWSKARLADNGLSCSAECEKCGAARDDAYHRIWECQWEEISVQRDSATTPEMRAEAARVGRDDWRFTRGLIPSPWNSTAPPRSDYEEIHVDGDGNLLREPLAVDGPVFIDGSALWPTNPEARRAGWAIVTVDIEGKMTGAIYGHVPWAESEEQTSGAAEAYALRRAAELCVGTLHAYTDYTESVEGVVKGRAATTGPRLKHAAHWRAFWNAVDGTRPIVEKVKGHSTEEEVAHSAELRWKREGNRHADRMAKRGARAHYVGDQWSEAKAADKTHEFHVDLCTWIGRALGEWAPEKQIRRSLPDREAMQKRRQKKRDAARAVGGHSVAWGRDGWKCQACGKEARTQSGAKKLLNQPCQGHITTRIPKQMGHGTSAHVLWTAEADNDQGEGGANVTWCQVCGAFSSTKLYKLKGRCNGPAQGAALTRLRALSGLRHPTLGYKLQRPHRMTDLVLEIMGKQAEERRRRYAEVVSAREEPATAGVNGPGGDADVRESSDVAMSSVQPRVRAREDDADSDFDVFGHGGGLDNITSQNVAAEAGTNYDGSRLVPIGLSATDNAAWAVPVGLATGIKRGTRVWEWLYSYGKWRWVPTSERCTGRPCFCDLQMGLEEVRTIITQHGIRSAAEAQRMVSAIEEERHRRRRHERAAMTTADDREAQSLHTVDEGYLPTQPSRCKRARITSEPLPPEVRSAGKRASASSSRDGPAARVGATQEPGNLSGEKRRRSAEPAADVVPVARAAEPYASRSDLLKALQHAARNSPLGSSGEQGERGSKRKAGDETPTERRDYTGEAIHVEEGGYFSSRKALLHALRLRDRGYREREGPE